MTKRGLRSEDRTSKRTPTGALETTILVIFSACVRFKFVQSFQLSSCLTLCSLSAFWFTSLFSENSSSNRRSLICFVLLNKKTFLRKYFQAIFGWVWLMWLVVSVSGWHFGNLWGRWRPCGGRILVVTCPRPSWWWAEVRASPRPQGASIGAASNHVQNKVQKFNVKCEPALWQPQRPLNAVWNATKGRQLRPASVLTNISPEFESMSVSEKRSFDFT